MSLIFHHLVQRDLRVVLHYYEEAGGIPLADRFFSELELLTQEIEKNPTKFHKIHGEIRRANMAQFPYHLLFRCDQDPIRILILRHHKQRPELGLGRN